MGKECGCEESVLYQAQKNGIPIFNPAVTDGAIGDCLFKFSFYKSGLIIDIVDDLKRLNDLSIHALQTGMIILGGGQIKHHISNANLMRNGADYSVFVNTSIEFDSSDAGARPDEAVSWGKIKLNAYPVKVYGENSIMFPLIASQTFVKNYVLASRLPENEKKDPNSKKE
jgi:deoxyhypusine synthase